MPGENAKGERPLFLGMCAGEATGADGTLYHLSAGIGFWSRYLCLSITWPDGTHGERLIDISDLFGRVASSVQKQQQQKLKEQSDA